MTPLDQASPSSAVTVHPVDVVHGLGSADRALLAACLALFDDTTLTRRLAALYEQARQKVSAALREEHSLEVTSSVRNTLEGWRDSPLPDAALRLLLWIRLREAFGLVPRLAISRRSTRRAADDLAATAVHLSDAKGLVAGLQRLMASWLTRRSSVDAAAPPATLAEVVRPVWAELMATAVGEGAGAMDDAEKTRLIEETRCRLQQLDDADQQALLDAIDADAFNDAAIRKILAASAGLTALSGGVSLAGFSAYVLAAQVSAFIPLVSGPALVSMLAVLTSPVTVIGLVAGVSYWSLQSAGAKVRGEVGMRVLALLAMHGAASGRDGTSTVLESFGEAARLGALAADLSETARARYAQEWRLLAPVIGKAGPAPAGEVERALAQPMADNSSQDARLGQILFPGPRGPSNAALIGALTVGDLLYSLAAIRPEVLEAADFSRSLEIDGSLAFAAFTHEFTERGKASLAGALSNLEGYVAEQVVAAKLVLDGHQVSLPESASQPGWDLLVDGQRFQVKCLSDSSGLVRHFERYEYPVLANAELADSIPDEYADRVFFVEGFSQNAVQWTTNAAVDAGTGLLSPDVPLFAFAVSAARNAFAFGSGEVTGPQAVAQVLLDGSVRAGLAAAGGYTGTSLGLLVFGPAGALVLGSVLPVLSQAQASPVLQQLEKLSVTAREERWQECVHGALDRLAARLESSIENKIELIREKYLSAGSGGVRDYVRARFEDDARALRESRVRLAQLTQARFPEAADRARRMVLWASESSIHPVLYQQPLLTLERALRTRPGFGERVEDAERWLSASARMVMDTAWIRRMVQHRTPRRPRKK